MPTRREALRALSIAALLPLVPVPAAAAEPIQIMHPWARPTIPHRPGVAYLGIHNNSELPDRLTGARAEGAGAAELHLAAQDANGVMTMTPVDALEIPALGMAELGPGGYHLMLFDLATPLEDGDEFALTLIFERAGEVVVRVPVSRTPQDPHRDGQGHAHGAGGMQHGTPQTDHRHGAGQGN